VIEPGEAGGTHVAAYLQIAEVEEEIRQ
jgi:hypothetical protein